MFSSSKLFPVVTSQIFSVFFFVHRSLLFTCALPGHLSPLRSLASRRMSARFSPSHWSTLTLCLLRASVALSRCLAKQSEVREVRVCHANGRSWELANETSIGSTANGGYHHEKVHDYLVRVIGVLEVGHGRTSVAKYAASQLTSAESADFNLPFLAQPTKFQGVFRAIGLTRSEVLLKMPSGQRRRIRLKTKVV